MKFDTMKTIKKKNIENYLQKRPVNTTAKASVEVMAPSAYYT